MWNISCIRENFLFPFTGIQKFLRETVRSCRRDGFVQTILGRRRYLPAIKDPNPYSKAHVCRSLGLFFFSELDLFAYPYLRFYRIYEPSLS